jgi:nucleoid DNA-binding protein
MTARANPSKNQKTSRQTKFGLRLLFTACSTVERHLSDPFSIHFMPNLTKRDMVVKISNEAEVTQQEAFAVIQKALELITDSLADGQTVELRNFGVFEVRLTKPRVGRNPNKPDKDVVIPARATVKFKPGKIMRQRVLLRTEELRKNMSV